MLNSTAKKGRPTTHHRASWGEKIQGLSRLADGRWKVSGPPVFKFTERDERLAVARFRQIEAEHEVFLSGGAAQAAMRQLYEGVGVLWVGVHCEADAAAGREAQRSDRIPGMARQQAERVRAGMAYDLEVDTTHSSSGDCAGVVAAHVIARNT